MFEQVKEGRGRRISISECQYRATFEGQGSRMGRVGERRRFVSCIREKGKCVKVARARCSVRRGRGQNMAVTCSCKSPPLVPTAALSDPCLCLRAGRSRFQWGRRRRGREPEGVTGIAFAALHARNFIAPAKLDCQQRAGQQDESGDRAGLRGSVMEMCKVCRGNLVW